MPKNNRDAPTTSSPANPTSLQAVRTYVTELLLTYSTKKTKDAAQLHRAYARLWRSITPQLVAGKKIRPYLCVLSYEAFGGKEKAAALEIATAWELLHVSLLIHDDIIDRDYIRHGRINIGGKYLEHYKDITDQAERIHYAHSAALLAGDLVFSGAYDFIMNSAFSAPKRQQALNVLEETLFRVIGGELLDSEAAALHVPINPFLIAEAKTASYSLIGPLISGALLAGASENQLVILRELGSVLGVGYQLVDDLLGILGNEKQTGKSIDSDLAEGKHSLVIMMSLKLMTKANRVRAEGWLKQPSQKHVSQLRQLIETTPIKEQVHRQLEKYKWQARKLIEQLQLPLLYEQTFISVVEGLFERKS